MIKQKEQGEGMNWKLIIGALVVVGALGGCDGVKEARMQMEFGELRQRCFGENTNDCQHAIAKFNTTVLEYAEEDLEKNVDHLMANRELTPAEIEGIRNYFANVKREIEEDRPGWFMHTFFGDSQMMSPPRWSWPMGAEEFSRGALELVAMMRARNGSEASSDFSDVQEYASTLPDEPEQEPIIIRTPGTDSSAISNELRLKLDSTSKFECQAPGCPEQAESRALDRALDMSLACDAAAGSGAGLSCYAGADDFYQAALAELEVETLTPEIQALRSFVANPMADANAARNLDALAEPCLAELIDQGIRGEDYEKARPGCYEQAKVGMTAEARADLEKAQNALGSAQARLEALQARRL